MEVKHVEEVSENKTDDLVMGGFHHVLNYMDEIKLDTCDGLMDKHVIVVPSAYTIDIIYAIAIIEIAKERVLSSHNKKLVPELVDDIIVAKDFDIRYTFTTRDVSALGIDYETPVIPVGFVGNDWYYTEYELRSPSDYNNYATPHTDPAGKMWNMYGHIISNRCPWFMVEFADIIAALDSATGSSYVDASSLSNFIGLRKRNTLPKSDETECMRPQPTYYYRNDYHSVIRKRFNEAHNGRQTVESNILANTVSDIITLLKTTLDMWLNPVSGKVTLVTQEYVEMPGTQAKQKVNLVFTPPGSLDESNVMSIFRLLTAVPVSCVSIHTQVNFYWIVDLGPYALIMYCFITKGDTGDGSVEYALNYYNMKTVADSPFSLFSSGTSVARIVSSRMDTVLGFIRWIDYPKEFIRGNSFVVNTCAIQQDYAGESKSEKSSECDEQLTADEKGFEKIMNMTAKEIMYEMLKIQKSDE